MKPFFDTELPCSLPLDPACSIITLCHLTDVVSTMDPKPKSDALYNTQDPEFLSPSLSLFSIFLRSIFFKYEDKYSIYANMCIYINYIPTCQVRVARFYVSCPPLLLLLLLIFLVLLLLPLLLLRRRTSAASSRSQGSPPDPNSKRWIKVILAGTRPERISEDISDRMLYRKSE